MIDVPTVSTGAGIVTILVLIVSWLIQRNSEKKANRVEQKEKDKRNEKARSDAWDRNDPNGIF